MKSAWRRRAFGFYALAAIGLVGCPQWRLRSQPATALAPMSFVGHYYLSGVMEVGSELLLKPDGRFEWMMAYGAEDRQASGTWSQQGNAITLVADQPGADAPLFRIGPQSPWDNEANEQMFVRRKQEENAEIRGRCSFWLDVGPDAVVAAATSDDPTMQPGHNSTVEEAKASLTRMEKARDAAEHAIASAMAATGDDRTAQMHQAGQLYTEWSDAKNAMLRSYDSAGVTLPQVRDVKVPPECVLKEWPEPEPLPPKDWTRGIAVHVGDPHSGESFSHVLVTFTYGDGHEETSTTGDGWAFAPLRGGTAVSKLTLTPPEPFNRSQSLAVKPMAEGVQAVFVNTAQLAPPAFKTMHLVIDGQALVAPDLDNGRYTKGN